MPLADRRRRGSAVELLRDAQTRRDGWYPAEDCRVEETRGDGAWEARMEWLKHRFCSSIVAFSLGLYEKAGQDKEAGFEICLAAGSQSRDQEELLNQEQRDNA